MKKKTSMRTIEGEWNKSLSFVVVVVNPYHLAFVVEVDWACIKEEALLLVFVNPCSIYFL